MGRNMTEADKAEVWERYGNGQSASAIARAMGWAPASVAELIRNVGGIRPKPPCRSAVRLSLDERARTLPEIPWERNRSQPLRALQAGRLRDR